MNLKNWIERRSPRFIWQRGMSLLERYDFGPGKAMDRIKDCVAELAGLGSPPTLPTPGIIVKRNPRFIRSLQDAGAEIAIHGYYHENLKDLTIKDAARQLEKAVQTFNRVGINVSGFRCPYTGCSNELVDSLPIGLFDYSSNQTIYWNVFDGECNHSTGLFFDTLKNFYDGQDSSQRHCLPWTRHNMIEIPVCVPDDLQLCDGLHFDDKWIAEIWERILQQTYLRGEIFTLLFHTELAALDGIPFRTLIRQAKKYQPGVWITRLQDVSEWWREKSKFKVEITQVNDRLCLNFTCSQRGTILARGVDTISSAPIWDGEYRRLPSKMLEVSANPRPFVGLSTCVPERTTTFLMELGYILDTGETASSCGVYLDENTLSKLTNDVELVKFIETSSAPLVRFWPWPDGARSALSITGDLDALSLLDYAARLFY